MQSIATVIEQLKERYIQPKPQVEPDNLPDFINPDDLMVVRRIKGGYSVEDLKLKRTFTVTKIISTNEVFCSCDFGKTLPHCVHKKAVKKEAMLLKKFKVDECQKRRAASAIGSYIRVLEKIVATYERRGDTQNCTYWFHKGKLLASKHNLRSIIES